MIKTMNSKMTTNYNYQQSNLKQQQQQQKQTKQTTRTGTESQKSRLQGGLSAGRGWGRRGGKVGESEVEMVGRK